MPAVEMALVDHQFGSDPNLANPSTPHHPYLSEMLDPNALRLAVDYRAQSCFVVRDSNETWTKPAMEALSTLTPVMRRPARTDRAESCGSIPAWTSVYTRRIRAAWGLGNLPDTIPGGREWYRRARFSLPDCPGLGVPNADSALGALSPAGPPPDRDTGRFGARCSTSRFRAIRSSPSGGLPSGTDRRGGYAGSPVAGPLHRSGGRRPFHARAVCGRLLRGSDGAGPDDTGDLCEYAAARALGHRDRADAGSGRSECAGGARSPSVAS